MLLDPASLCAAMHKDRLHTANEQRWAANTLEMCARFVDARG